MVITTGTVRDGRIELLGTHLPEGDMVMVLASEGTETFAPGPADETRLAAATQEADRGDVVPGTELLSQLRLS